MFYFPLLGEMYELVINIYISLLYISSSIKYLIKKKKNQDGVQCSCLHSSAPGPVCRYKKVSYSQGSVLHLHKCTACTCSMRGSIPVFRCKHTCVDHHTSPGIDHHTSPGIDHHTSPGIDHHTSPGIDHHTSPGIDHHTSPGIDHHTSPDIDHHTSPGIDHHTSPDIDHHTSPGIDHHTSGSGSDHHTSPINGDQSGNSGSTGYAKTTG